MGLPRRVFPILTAASLLTGCHLLPPWPDSQAAATAAAEPEPPRSRAEAVFSPEVDPEALVLRVIAGAQQSIRLAGHTFTSPAMVRALLVAKRRGVDVRVLLDDRSNRGPRSIAAMNQLARAGIPVRVVSNYAVHHDRYLVVDERHLQTGSLPYGKLTSRPTSDNALVIWDDPELAKQYLAHWDARWRRGILVEAR